MTDSFLIFDNRIYVILMPGTHIQIIIIARRHYDTSCPILKPLELLSKAVVTVSPHHITIIKVWLNKAITNFD